MKVRITAPTLYTGTSACVKFERGVAEADINERQLAYFERHTGYVVTALEMAKAPKKTEAPKPKPSGATKKKGGKNNAK